MILQAVPPDWATLSMIVGAACVSAGAGYVVSRQISDVATSLKADITALKEDFTKALTAHKEEDSEKFHDHALRLGAIDLKLEGVTHSGKNPDKMDLKGHGYRG